MFLFAQTELTKFNIPSWHWPVLIAWFLFLLLLDLFVLHRKDKEPSFRHALGESIVWVSLGLALGGVFWTLYGSAAGQQYFSGYLIEQSLSIDNVFAWSVILSFFAIPPKYQYRVLFWGIFGALVMRAVFIFAGISVINRFEPILIVLGGVLIWTGVTLFSAKKGHEFDPGSSKLFQWLKRHLRVSHKTNGNKFITYENGKRVVTGLFLALVVVEFTDIIFAIDSVPAILAISRDPFIVFASNAAAIMGLRSLYFVFAKFKDRFWLLDKGLGVLLVAIGIKMALAPTVILGRKWFGFEIPTYYSLIGIGVILTISVALSLTIKPPREDLHSAP